MKDPRKIERVLMAASNCKPLDEREAAIIGSIAHCLVATGHFREAEIAAHAADNMAWAFTVAKDIDKSVIRQGFTGKADLPLPLRMFPEHRRGYPTTNEIKRAADKFRTEYEKYEPPSAAAA